MVMVLCTTQKPSSNYDTCRLCYFELIFCATLIFQPSIHLSVFSSSFNNKFTTQFTTAMHTISHSLAQWAPPATHTQAHWQPHNAIQSLSARSSPAGYLHTPASSVSSASLTPHQALTVSDNNHLQNIIITPTY